MSQADAGAFFLVGPTASGKTEVAQLLAEKRGWGILSADSMLVYRGLDVGTAKPAREQRGRVPYYGLDLVDASEPFSVGAFMRHAREAFEDASARGMELIVVGGTGLYVKCLTEGLDPAPPGDPALRRKAEAILAETGVGGLQSALRAADGARYEALADKCNPRRLVRAYELAILAAREERTWGVAPSVPLAGLNPAAGVRRQNIDNRARRMYETGLMAEVQGLLDAGVALSETARQAIGYAEALAVVGGRMELEQAVETTARRTRQLAKRQMTWFRNQANVAWVDVGEGDAVGDLAEKVEGIWEQYGRTPVNI